MLTFRTRSIATAVALAARATSIAVQVLGVPLAITMVGADGYGAFIILTSITTWFSLANLGIPNAILSPLSSAIAKNDTVSVRHLLSTSLWTLVAMSMVLTALTALATWAMPVWRNLFSDSLSLEELRTATMVAGACACISLPLSLCERIFLALQRPAAPQALIIIGSVTALSLLSVHPGTSLSALCTSLLVPPVVAQLVGLLIAIRATRSRPNWRRVDRATLTSSLRTGRHFLLVQLAAIAMWQTDNLLVAYFFDADAVAGYATAFRFAAIGSVILGSTMLGVWPAVAAARTRGDIMSVRRSVTSQSRIVTSLSSIAGLSIAIFGDDVVQIWTLGQTKAIPGLMTAIGCYLPIFAYCFVQAQFLSGLGRIRGQMMYGIAAAALNLLLSIALAPRLGPAGVCWATVISSLPAAVLSHAELRQTLAQEQS